LQLRFFSDNTGFNRVAGFGIPVLITVSNNALIELDTSVATTFAGSMAERFAVKSTDTDSTGGADPTFSPVHFVLGAVTFDSGATGEGLFANLKLTLRNDTATITVDTLSTAILSPTLVTESASGYDPGWKTGGFTCGVTSSVRDLKGDKDAALPSQYNLKQNFPNPFNASTLIEFDLPQVSHVRLEIFNLVGQLVRVLTDQTLGPGYKQVIWDGKNQRGNEVASGVYFYRLRVEGKFAQAKSMVLIK
jgi:hypothetical protein